MYRVSPLYTCHITLYQKMTQFLLFLVAFIFFGGALCTALFSTGASGFGDLFTLGCWAYFGIAC